MQPQPLEPPSPEIKTKGTSPSALSKLFSDRFLYQSDGVEKEAVQDDPRPSTTPKSKVTIGRVSPDFVRTWTYLRH